MNKKYIVRLTTEQRASLCEMINEPKGSPQQIRRARILLKADANGPMWTDRRIAEVLSCRVKTVENVRRRLTMEGFERALNRKGRREPPRSERLNPAQRAMLVELRRGTPPAGSVSWSLRLLAEYVVALNIVDSISHETVRQALKRTV